MEPWPPEVSLIGVHAALVPLGPEHEQDLAAASAEGELHKVWYTWVPSAEDMAVEIERRRALRASGWMLPFAVIDNRTKKAVGMTTYMAIEPRDRRLEIGATWYAPSAQRTAINTECKLMLLRHAFEALDCIAVEFRTHVLNRQSRTAIERLGAKLDGILRAHRIMDNGTVRDTAVYSIIASEWPAVKANLEWLLARPR